jgi:uroporphyrinogen decarboxylase
MHDDYGSQKTMQMSPAIWRQMIKPNLKRIVDLCHSHGVYYEQHSCGKIERIVPDLCEIGVDSWQGMHINDVPALKKITGNRLNYHMTLNMQKYMAADYAGKLTEEILREDLRSTFMDSAAGGNYVALGGMLQKSWWGSAIIEDELHKCKAMLVFE